jgi:hypothetical protein
MHQWLKKHFIPHEGNSYQPHFLRAEATMAMMAFILLVEAIYLANIFFVFPKSDYVAAIFATVLVNQTNAKRLEGELRLLTPNPILEKAAQMKAADMAAKGYFAHVAPDGTEPWYWFEQAGYKYAAAGENLAVNFTESSDVTNAWMQSPTHRANIMNGDYTEIGIATAEGVYKGRNAIFVVEEFGRPAPIAPAAPTVAAATAVAAPTVTPTTAAPVKPIAAVVTPKPATPQPKPAVVPKPVLAAPTFSATTVPSVVAGAETTLITEPESATIPAETVMPIPALPHTASPVSAIIAAPRQVTTIFYVILGAILALALGLAVFIEIRIQHARIIWNGVLLIALIGALIALNTMLGVGAGAVVGA